MIRSPIFPVPVSPLRWFGFALSGLISSGLAGVALSADPPVAAAPAALAVKAPAVETPAAKELQATVEKYVAAYNAGAVDQVMSFWTENADFVDIRGRFHEGRDLISALFRRGFANNPGRKLVLTSQARKFLAPTAAMDDGILELSGPEGEKHRGRYSVVWVNVEGAWKIRSARDIPLETEAPPEAARPPLEEFSWMIGQWEAKSGKHQITLDCRWERDNSFLVQTFRIKSAEDDFQVVTWLGYDPSADRFHSWFFDSRGGFGNGPWSKRGKIWKGTMTAVLPDGQTGSSIFSWEQVDENNVIWKAVEREVGGEPLPDAEQKYVRVKGPPK